MIRILLLMLVGYLLGSIPFGLLIAKMWNIDIRRHGSGNIGATNVFRTLGLVPGALVFMLDFLKGVLAVYLGFWVGGDPLVIILLGVMAILGHMYSLFLRFKGGKGAATGLGVLFGVAPGIFLFAAILAAVIIYASRYVSIATMVTSLVVVVLMFAFHYPLPYSLATLVVTFFIFLRHVPNIKRLLKGTELQIGAR